MAGLGDILPWLIRRKKPVSFVDWKRTEPVSREFGFERGTPIDRYYIESFLRANQALIAGTVLETDDSRYARMFPDLVTRREVLYVQPGNQQATIVGDLTKPETLPSGTIDCFICTQTLNFIFHVHEAIAGIERLLKPQGVLLMTAAGVCQISNYDMKRWGDYWRITTRATEDLLAERFELMSVQSYGNALAVTATIQGVVVEDLPDSKLLDDTDPDYQLVVAAVARKRR